MMRRRLEVLIPIVLIAMWVQLLAPIAAFGVIAQTASNSIALSQICHGTASQDRAQPDPARSQDDSGSCCSICSIGHGGDLALDPPSPLFVKLQRQYQKLSWLEAAASVLVIKAGSNAQARAPPAIS